MQNEMNLDIISISQSENSIFEAYEGISLNKKIKIFGFYIFCLSLLCFAISFIPSVEITQEKELSTNYSNFFLKINYQEILSYQPFVSLSIENRNNNLAIISLDYNSELPNIKMNDTISISIRLDPNKKKQLIMYKDVQIDNLNFACKAAFIQGSYNNIFNMEAYKSEHYTTFCFY